MPRQPGHHGGKTVDEYIARAPAAARPMLRALREAIRSAAPRANERISYAMPYYEHHGRLAYFAAFRDHVSFFALPGRASEDYADEIAPYRAGTSALRFPLGTRVPVGLIKKLVRARAKENEAKAKARASR